MKYIIMCGGKYPFWKTPKHLSKIKGEPVVARTIRLLKAVGVDDIAISSNDYRFENLGVEVLHHENSFDVNEPTSYWVDAFYPMNEPVCYLFGDVVFSKSAIKQIVDDEPEDSIQFYASAAPFPDEYIKPWAEPFAFKVYDTERFKKAIQITKEHQDQGDFWRMPVSWELWQVIRRTTLNVILPDYYIIRDYTCDIDEPGDIKKIERYIVDDD